MLMEWQTIICPKDADCSGRSVIRVYAVCPGLSVQKLIPCLHKVFKALQNRISGAITIYTDNLTATENFNVPQLSPPQDLDQEAL